VKEERTTVITSTLLAVIKRVVLSEGISYEGPVTSSFRIKASE
jgi:hypothetical protein